MPAELVNKFLSVAAVSTGIGAASESPDITANGMKSAAGSFLVGVVIFLVVIYILYFIYKYVLSGNRGKLGLGFIKSRNMRVVEITPVGPGSTIQLVKVSEEYFLIGVTRNQITFLTKTDCPPASDEISEEGRTPVFERYLSNIFKRTKKEDQETGGKAKDGEHGGETKNPYE